MSQASPGETAQTYCPPSVTQFSVFLDNKVGKLLELLSMFDTAGTCDLCAFAVQEASDYAVVRLITNASREAKKVLEKNDLSFTTRELLVVELIGGHDLSSLCQHLLRAELNIHFAYPLMLRPNGTPTIALAVDDLTLAGQILRRKEFRLLGEADLPRKH
ncbi:MAG TPA: hypothetical protein VG797_01890 [Phycisphaerales bacterium]|nr:hypothetical protein [Phycisphaerales bacterium]